MWLGAENTNRWRNQCEIASCAADALVLDHRREDLESDQDTGGLPAPDIVSRFLLEKGADFGKFVGARRAIVEQVRQFGAVWTDIGGRILR